MNENAVAAAAASLYTVDGVALSLVEPTPDEVAGVFEPIAERIRAALQSRAGDGGVRRCIVAVAGPPGAGKSVFVARLMRFLAPAVAPAAAIAHLPLDGFHLPNRELARRFREEITDNGECALIPLTSLKGLPEAFDAEAYGAAVTALRDSMIEYRAPLYDRILHDPRPGALRIGPEHRLVLTEGNFLLLDEPPWDALRALFELRVFIDADDATLRANLAARHARGGKAPAQIEAHWRRVDHPNIALVRPTGSRADVRVRDAGQHQLVREDES